MATPKRSKAEPGNADQKTWKVGKMVRMNPDVAMMGAAVAKSLGLGIGEYLSRVAEPKVRSDYAKVLRGEKVE